MTRSGTSRKPESRTASPGAELATRTRRLFLAAARVDAGAAADATRGVAESALWEGAAGIARRVNQEPLFLRLVREAGAGALLLPGTLADLEAQARFHAFRWAEIRDVALGLLGAYSRRGIRPILLKGIAQAGEIYDPPAMRPMRDIDLLVRAADLEAARDTALGSGFVPDRERHPPAKYAGHHHLPPLFHEETGLCLEVHHHLMRLPEKFEGFPPVEDAWQRPKESALFPGKAWTLEPTLDVLNTCIHVTHGDNIGRRAQNLIDLSRAVEVRGSSVDWARLEAIATSPDVARALAVPLSYLEREGLPAAAREVIASILRKSRLRPWELELLQSLIDRYRIGSPPPWRWISGRVSNILWRETLRRGSLPGRAARMFLGIAARKPARR